MENSAASWALPTEGYPLRLIIFIWIACGRDESDPCSEVRCVRAPSFVTRLQSLRKGSGQHTQLHVTEGNNAHSPKHQ